MDGKSTPSATGEIARGGGVGARMGVRRRAFVAAAGGILLFFAVWECAERRWMPRDQNSPLHALHLLRGIGASLAAVGIVAWFIRHASPSPAPASASQQWWVRHQVDQEQWARNYGRWFIIMRWIAVGVSAGLIFFATQVAGLLEHDLWLPLAMTIATLAVCNALYSMLMRRGWHPRRLVPAQIIVDLLLLTILLHFSGGIENPLSLLMVFHVIIAGIVLDRRRCFMTAAVASALYALLALGEWSGILHHYTLFTFPHFHEEHGLAHAARFSPYVLSSIAVQSIVLLLAAYFVSTLAERVLYDERELAAMAERAMAERQLLERAMDTTGTGLRVLDQNLSSQWLNEQWTRLIRDGETREGKPDPAKQTLADGQVRLSEISELVGATAAGSASRVLQITTAPLYDKTGQVSQVVELAQDVTRQREAQARLIRSSRLAAMGELAGQVAHEVNNPIAVISAKARLLLNDRRNEMSAHVSAELEKMTYYADRVGRVAQGLLTYCRPSSAQRSPIDMRVPIERAIGLVEPRAKAGRVEIHDRTPPDLPKVPANCDEMEQVVCNLLLNALDAMPDGGRLTIDGRRSGGNVEITVEDTGCGMSAEIRQRIFDPFFTTKSKEGTGLGLAISQELVRGGGGSIEVESEPGRGSKFTMTLPAESEGRDNG